MHKGMKITNIITNDGARQFISIAEEVSWKQLRKSVAKLNGATETYYISDGITEMWLDFTYKQHRFTVNNQYGEYWFFVEDACCPESILIEVASHFLASLVK